MRKRLSDASSHMKVSIDVLEDAGPSERPFLVHVAHENDHRARLLGKAHHARRGVALDLGHAPRRAVGIIRVQRLVESGS